MPSDLRPVCIVSVGRSGSQALAHTFAAHPAFDARHEADPPLLDLSYRAWASRCGAIDADTELGRRRDAWFAEAAEEGRVALESSHSLTHLVRPLDRRYRPRFVHLIRDGHAFAASALARGWYRVPPWARRLWIEAALRGSTVPLPGSAWECDRLWPPMAACSRVARLGWLWAEFNLGARWLLAGTGQPWHELRLEELVAAPRSTLAQLLDAWEVEATPCQLDAMVAALGERANHGRKAGRPGPRPLTAAERSEFDVWAAPAQRVFGAGGSPVG
jgi:hypothetical protein